MTLFAQTDRSERAATLRVPLVTRAYSSVKPRASPAIIIWIAALWFPLSARRLMHSSADENLSDLVASVTPEAVDALVTALRNGEIGLRSSAVGVAAVP